MLFAIIMPQLLQLRYFVAIAENGSIRQAAETLGVTQSVMSRSIARLEEKLGVSLFERRNTGVRLTNAGRQFLEDVLPAMRQLERAQRLAHTAGRAESGQVRIGILTSLAGGFLRDLIATYQARQPGIVVDISSGGRDEHMAALRARELDIVFAPNVCGIKNCEYSELWCERIHVALESRHRLAGKEELDWPDLREEDFITSSVEPGPEFHDYISQRLIDYSPIPKIEMRCACHETLMNLVSLGHGLTITTAAWAKVRLPGLVLRPLANPVDTLRFSAIWLAANDNPALRCLISTAHVLARRVRRGNSDWLPDPISSQASSWSISADGRKPDRSP